MESTTECAKAIRQTLKKCYGWTARQVSVRSHCYSMGSTIYVTINDPSIDDREVTNVANKHRHVRYDHELGEVLGGGNQFVDVSYSKRAHDQVLAEHADLIAEIMAAASDPIPGQWRAVRHLKVGMARSERHVCLCVGSEENGMYWINPTYPESIARALCAKRAFHQPQG